MHYALRKTSVSLAVLSMAVFGIPAAHAATTAPAVSRINGSIALQGGALHGDNMGSGGIGGVSGSLSFPLSHSFGAQIDAMGGTVSHHGASGLGGHVFWRDPARGLAGVTGANYTVGSHHSYRYGLEGELYSGKATFSARGGWQGGNVTRAAYGAGDVFYYSNLNLRLDAGASHLASKNIGRIGFEWQLPHNMSASRGTVLFANGGIGNKNYSLFLLGVRFYFGGSADNLIDHDRQDDPDNTLMDDMGPIGNGSVAGITCFVAGTLVLMADGTEKPVEDLTVGDTVVGTDGKINTVQETETSFLEESSLFAINGGTPFITGHHPLLTEAGWKTFKIDDTKKRNPGLGVTQIAVGDLIVMQQGSLRVDSIKTATADAKTQVYNFLVSGNGSYLVKPPEQTQFLGAHNSFKYKEDVSEDPTRRAA